MGGAVDLHSPNAPSWRGAQLGGAQGQLYFTLSPWLSKYMKETHPDQL